MHINRKSFRVIGATAVVTLALTSLAACGDPPQPADTTHSSSDGGVPACLAPPQSPITTKPVIAVLDAITPADRNPDITRVRSAAIRRVVDAGTHMGARLLVSGIGSDNSATTLTVNTQLDSPGPNSLMRKQADRCKHDGIASTTTAMTTRSPAGSLDVFAAIHSLAAHVTGLTKTRVDVVILSSTLNATQPVNLSNPSVLAQPAKHLVDVLAHAGVLADCHGWNVYIVGGGRTAHGSLSDTANSRLQAFWSAFFQRCGGRLALYDSDLAQYPISATKTATPAPLAAKPALTKPSSTNDVLVATHRQVGAVKQVVFTLADGVLFDKGSATLAANTAPTLDALRHLLLITYPHEPVTITGFTDDIPDARPGGNQALSQQRAATVASWLITHGIDIARVAQHGEGPQHPVADNTTSAGRAANRRVEIAVTLDERTP